MSRNVTEQFHGRLNHLEGLTDEVKGLDGVDFPAVDALTGKMLGELAKDPLMLGKSVDGIMRGAVDQVLDEALAGMSEGERKAFLLKLEAEMDSYERPGVSDGPVRKGSKLTKAIAGFEGLRRSIVKHAARSIDRDGAVLRYVDNVNENVTQKEKKESVSVLLMLIGEFEDDVDMIGVGEAAFNATGATMQKMLEGAHKKHKSAEPFGNWMGHVDAGAKRVEAVINNLEINEAFGNADADTIRRVVDRRARQLGWDQGKLLKRLYQAAEYIKDVHANSNDFKRDTWPEIREEKVKRILEEHKEERERKILKSGIPSNLGDGVHLIPAKLAGESAEDFFTMMNASLPKSVEYKNGFWIVEVDSAAPNANCEQEFLGKFTKSKDKKVQRVVRGYYKGMLENDISSGGDLDAVATRVADSLNVLGNHYGGNGLTVGSVMGDARRWFADVMEGIRVNRGQNASSSPGSAGGGAVNSPVPVTRRGTVLPTRGLGLGSAMFHRVLNRVGRPNPMKDLLTLVKAGNTVEKSMVKDLIGEDDPSSKNVRGDASKRIDKLLGKLF